MPKRLSWRPFFVLSALLLPIGGFQHPDGTMAEMLGNPAWVRSHIFTFAGFLALFVGLLFLRSHPTLSEAARRWTRFAVIGSALQVVEMALHTAAVVDHANLVAGNATPVLSTHVVAAVVLYPVFSASVVGLIIVGARDGALGSRWVTWLGVVGLAAHGLAPAFTRSWMRPRSNSAIAPRICSWSRPAGVVASIPSARETNPEAAITVTW